MKGIINLKKSVILTALLSVAMSGLANPSTAANSRRELDVTSATATEVQIAQVSNGCRQVSEPGGIVVRQDPRPDSPIVGEIDNFERVAIDGPGASGWVPVSVPFEGYVQARYLTYCQEAVEPPIADCREVIGTGVRIWREPSFNSAVVGTIEFREQVAIENRGANGWVPIYAPFDGYIRAENLKFCS